MQLPSILKELNELVVENNSYQLWSGCGQILQGCYQGSPVIIKYSKVPDQIRHSRIRQSDTAKLRKKMSYINEVNFYNTFKHIDAISHLISPCLLGIAKKEENVLILSDFKFRGFSNTNHVTEKKILAVIQWLAKFHAYFLYSNDDFTKQTGGYWHLSTRPDEFIKMDNSRFKESASKFEQLILSNHYLTMIHGDAKLANFAFNDRERVLGYDFQYVGNGIGLQDLMLFMTSIFSNESCYQYENKILDAYFEAFHLHLSTYFTEIEKHQIEQAWRSLWNVIWADFYRFLLGWKPNHAKITAFMKERAHRAVNAL